MTYAGSLGASVVGYILPAAIYYKTHESEYNETLLNDVTPLYNEMHLVIGNGSINICSRVYQYLTLSCQCIYCLKQFWFSAFSFFFGILLSIFGLYTVLFNPSSSTAA